MRSNSRRWAPPITALGCLAIVGFRSMALCVCHGSSREDALLLPGEAVVSSRGYCFQSKESPAGSAAAVAKHASRVGPAHACFRDCTRVARQPLTVALMRRPRRGTCLRRRLLRVIRAKAGKRWMARPPLMLCSGSSAAAPRHRRRAAPTLARPRRCSRLAPDDEATGCRPGESPLLSGILQWIEFIGKRSKFAGWAGARRVVWAAGLRADGG